MPWWVRAGVSFGAPTIAAGYLMWVLVSSIQDGQNVIISNQTTIIGNQTAMLEMMRGQNDATSSTAVQLGHIEMVLTQICAQSAESPDERAACFER